VLLEKLKHVVEKANAGVYNAFSLAINVERKPNARLVGVAFDFCFSHIHV
jgi:hypothetical protein